MPATQAPSQLKRLFWKTVATEAMHVIGDYYSLPVSHASTRHFAWGHEFWPCLKLEIPQGSKISSFVTEHKHEIDWVPDKYCMIVHSWGEKTQRHERVWLRDIAAEPYQNDDRAEEIKMTESAVNFITRVVIKIQEEDVATGLGDIFKTRYDAGGWKKKKKKR